MTPAMQSAIAADSLSPVHLVSLAFDGGTQYHTDAYKSLSWGGSTWNGGNLISLQAVEESIELRIPQLRVTLSGVNQANIATALTENAIDREVVIYLGLLDANEQLIADPVEQFRGRIDGYSFSEDGGGGTAKISWTCVSHLADFERTAGRHTNDSEQQILFPGDLGFEYAAKADQDLKWGTS